MSRIHIEVVIQENDSRNHHGPLTRHTRTLELQQSLHALLETHLGAESQSESHSAGPTEERAAAERQDNHSNTPAFFLRSLSEGTLLTRDEVVELKRQLIDLQQMADAQAMLVGNGQADTLLFESAQEMVRTIKKTRDWIEGQM